jgi:hypothetical protein
MTCNDSFLYISIVLHNSNRYKPIFNWSGTGNTAFAVAVAKEEVHRKVPVDSEGHFTIHIKIRNDKTNKTEFEWENRQGNIRNALMSAENYLDCKLGINLVNQIKYHMTA